MTNTAPQPTPSTPIAEQTPRVADAAREVSGTVTHEAASVARETAQQAKKLALQARDELQEQAGTQQQRIAAGLRTVGDELSTMSTATDSSGIASGIASSVGERVDGVAEWLERREPADVMHEVADFARARPIVFIGLAAVVGVLAGRLTRSLATSDEPSPTTAARS